MNYDNFKFINTRNLFKLSLEYPHLSLGFNCILKLRAGYKIQNIIQLLQLEVVEFLTIVLNSALAVKKVNNFLFIGYLNALPFFYVDVNL